MKIGHIYIYGYIGGDAVNPVKIQEAVNALLDEGVKDFIVYINSEGGDVFSGIAIYNILKPLKPIVEINGLAASMGSVIAMCGAKIRMAENAYMMIHNPITGAYGDRREMEKAQKKLEVVEKSISQAYIDKTGLSKDDITAIMDDESWYTAADALEKGLCDEVFKAGETENRIQDVIIDSLVLSEKHNNEGENKMDPKQLRTLLGLPEAATDEQVTASLTARNESAKSIRVTLKLPETATDQEVIDKLKPPETPPVVNSEDLKTQLATLQQKIEAIESGDVKAKATALVEAGITEMKVAPAMKEDMIAMAEKDFEHVQAVIKNMPVTVATQGQQVPPQPVREIEPVEALTAHYRSQEPGK